MIFFGQFHPQRHFEWHYERPVANFKSIVFTVQIKARKNKFPSPKNGGGGFGQCLKKVFMGRTSLKSLDFSNNCSWWRVKCLVLRAHGSNFWMHDLINIFGGTKFLKILPCLIFMIDYRASQKSAHLRIFFNPGLGAKIHDRLATWFADFSKQRNNWNKSDMKSEALRTLTF